MDRHDDVMFRGKQIGDLGRDELLEALHRALDRLKEIDPVYLSALNERRRELITSPALFDGVEVLQRTPR